MKQLVQCPNGHQFRCDEQYFGRRVKCSHPGCTQRFVLKPITGADGRATRLPEPEPIDPQHQGYAIELNEHTENDSPLRCDDLIDGEPDEELREVISIITIRAHISKLNRSRLTLTRGLIFLAVSLLFFITSGTFRFDFTFILLLVPVLLLHEAGHLLAMLAFGYRNTQVFFIPFIGAAVSGHKPVTRGWQEAVIALAGPLPSILLGYVLLFVGINADSNILLTLAGLLILLNGINLLPMVPLDGWRVLKNTILSRTPYVELVFQIITGVAFVLLAMSFGDLVLGIFAFFVLLTLRRAVQVCRITETLRKHMPNDMYGDFEQLPDSVCDHVIRMVRDLLPSTADEDTVAVMVREVWLRLNTKPPNFYTACGLLAVHSLAFLSIFVVPIIAIMMMIDGALPTPSTGVLQRVVNKASVSQEARKTFTTEAHVAARRGDPDILEFVIQRGADINGRDSKQHTPMMVAARTQNNQIITLILQLGGDPTLTDRLQQTALHHASSSGCAPCADILLDAGLHVDQPDVLGESPLHLAVQNDQPTVVKLLLDAGADPTTRCKNAGDALAHAYTDPPLKHEQLIVQYINNYLDRQSKPDR